MSKRALSQTPEAQDARERRFMTSINKQASAFHTEVRAFMDKGLSFDDAWIAAGGIVIPVGGLIALKNAAEGA